MGTPAASRGGDSCRAHVHVVVGLPCSPGKPPYRVAVVMSGKLKSVDLAVLKVGGPRAQEMSGQRLSRASGECFTPENRGAQDDDEEAWI